jgi:pimeloyl-ACP methyl ester carboxylesterase
VLAILLVTALTVAARGTVLPTPPAAQGDFAGLVDIGGRRLYLECRGSGGPTVVLVSGYGNHGGIWSLQSEELPQPPVLPAVAGFTRVCAHDRPGTIGLDFNDRSRSDPLPQPSTAQQAVHDLHALLHAAAVPGPYVLVGHSLGGLYSRLYASTYPDDVIGMVLVDATSEVVRAALTPAQWAFVSDVMLPDLASPPEFEAVDFDAAYDATQQAEAAQPLRPLPLVVLSAMGPPGGLESVPNVPPGLSEAMAAAWPASQAFLAGLVPDARQVVVPDTGHYIQLEQPLVVIDAIRQVVEAVRDPASWDELVSCCAR